MSELILDAGRGYLADLKALHLDIQKLQQENAKLLDEVTERRFTDECTDKLLDEREAENKRLRLVARAVVDFLNEKVKL